MRSKRASTSWRMRRSAGRATASSDPSSAWDGSSATVRNIVTACLNSCWRRSDRRSIGRGTSTWCRQRVATACSKSGGRSRNRYPLETNRGRRKSARAGPFRYLLAPRKREDRERTRIVGAGIAGRCNQVVGPACQTPLLNQGHRPSRARSGLPVRRRTDRARAGGSS
jgi:hypothetical protein